MPMSVYHSLHLITFAGKFSGCTLVRLSGLTVDSLTRCPNVTLDNSYLVLFSS